MNFNITIIRPRGFHHSSAFAEVADSVAWSLSELGHEATVTHNWISKTEQNIIFGCELLAPNQPEALPPGTIIYNLEQSSQQSFWKTVSVAQNSKATVWDYSLSNTQKWQEAGIYARHVPIGYTPNLTRIPKASTQDIDVLFLGWMTPRREKILGDLRAAGLRVVASSNCYGGARDHLLSRAKVCLNIHHDGRNLFEIVRVSYYLANAKCVVSECSEDDSEYADILGGYGRGDNPVDICVSILNNTADQTAFEEAGFKKISECNFTSTIQKALTSLTPQEKVAQRFLAARQQGDMKDYVEWIRDHAKGTCLEIGVRDGASTSAFLSGLEASGGVLLSCDTEDCSGLFEGHPAWKFIRSSSQNPKLRVPDIDVLLIDGDHTRTGYRADLERFFPLVKPGGLILSHDIETPIDLTSEGTGDPDRPSRYMRDEYFSFCSEHNLRHEELPGFSGMGVMYKPLVNERWGGPDSSRRKCGCHNSELCIHGNNDSDESWQASEALLSK